MYVSKDKTVNKPLDMEPSYWTKLPNNLTMYLFQILSSKFAGNVFVNLIGTWAVSEIFE